MAEPIVTWSFPTTIVFGIGAVSSLAGHVKRQGASRALIVCDAGVVRVGIAERVRSLLTAGGVEAVVFYRVDPNPVESNVSDGGAAYRAHGARAVGPVSGGSPRDRGHL